MLQGTFAGRMQQDQLQHLRKVCWSGAGCALKDITVQLEPHVKYHVQREHTGKAD